MSDNRKMRRFKASAARGASVICFMPPYGGQRGTCDLAGCDQEWELVWHLRAGGTSRVIKRRCQAHRDAP